MSQRKGVQSLPRELTGSCQLSWEAECWPWINSGNLGTSLALCGVWKLLCEWVLHLGSPGVAAPHFGTQSKPGKGIANTLGSDTLSFPLREVKFRGINHNQACQDQVIFQGSRAEGTASHPCWGFCSMSCNMMEPHSPQPAFRSGIFPPCQKAFKLNHHSQSAERGGNWYLHFQHCSGENRVKSMMGRVRKPSVNPAPLGLKVNCKPKS